MRGRSATIPITIGAVIVVIAVAWLWSYSTVSDSNRDAAVCGEEERKRVRDVATVVHPRMREHATEMKEAVEAFAAYPQVALEDADYLRLLMRIQHIVDDANATVSELGRNRARLDEARSSACYAQLSAHIDKQLSLHEALEKRAHNTQSHINAALDTTTTLWTQNNALERISLRLTLKRAAHLLNDNHIASLPSSTSSTITIILLGAAVISAITAAYFFMRTRRNIVRAVSPRQPEVSEPEPEIPHEPPVKQVAPSPSPFVTPLLTPKQVQEHEFITATKKYIDVHPLFKKYFSLYAATHNIDGIHVVTDIIFFFGIYNAEQITKLLKNSVYRVTIINEFLLELEQTDTIQEDILKEVYTIYPLFDTIKKPFIRITHSVKDITACDDSVLEHIKRYEGIKNEIETLHDHHPIYYNAVINNIIIFLICYIKNVKDFTKNNSILRTLFKIKNLHENFTTILRDHAHDFQLLNRIELILYSVSNHSIKDITLPSSHSIKDIATKLRRTISSHNYSDDLITYIGYALWIVHKEICDIYTIYEIVNLIWHKYPDILTDEKNIPNELSKTMLYIDQWENVGIHSIYRHLYPIEIDYECRVLRSYIVSNGWSFAIKFQSFDVYTSKKCEELFKKSQYLTIYYQELQKSINVFNESKEMTDGNTGVQAIIDARDVTDDVDIPQLIRRYLTCKMMSLSMNDRTTFIQNLSIPIPIVRKIKCELLQSNDESIKTTLTSDQIFDLCSNIPPILKDIHQSMISDVSTYKQYALLITACALYNRANDIMKSDNPIGIIQEFENSATKAAEKVKITYNEFLQNNISFLPSVLRNNIEKELIRILDTDEKDIVGCDHNDVDGLVKIIYRYDIFNNYRKVGWLLPLAVNCIRMNKDKYFTHDYTITLIRANKEGMFITNNKQDYEKLCSLISNKTEQYNNYISTIRYDALHIDNKDNIVYSAEYHSRCIHAYAEDKNLSLQNIEQVLNNVIYDVSYYTEKGVPEDEAKKLVLTLQSNLSSLFMEKLEKEEQNKEKQQKEKQKYIKELGNNIERKLQKLPELAGEITTKIYEFNIAKDNNVSLLQLKQKKSSIDELVVQYNEIFDTVKESIDEYNELAVNNGSMYEHPQQDDSFQGSYQQMIEYINEKEQAVLLERAQQQLREAQRRMPHQYPRRMVKRESLL